MSFIIKLLIKISIIYARLIIPNSKDLLITLECNINQHSMFDKFEDDHYPHLNNYFQIYIGNHESYNYKKCISHSCTANTIRGCIKKAREFMLNKVKKRKAK